MLSRAASRFASAARPALARAVCTSARPLTSASSARWLLATASAVIGASAVLQLSGASPSSSTAFAAPAAPQPGQRLPPEGVVGTNYERTFIAIKPDGVQRGLVNKIIARFEEKGFQLVGLKLIVPTEDLARGHYESAHQRHIPPPPPLDRHPPPLTTSALSMCTACRDLSKKPFFPGLVRFFSSGPIVAMVWQGKGAIATGRRLLGETDPAKSLPGSIRGDYSVDIASSTAHTTRRAFYERLPQRSPPLATPTPLTCAPPSLLRLGQGRNIIHGSDGPEGAKHEISFWFTAPELYGQRPAGPRRTHRLPSPHPSLGSSSSPSLPLAPVQTGCLRRTSTSTRSLNLSTSSPHIELTSIYGPRAAHGT